MKTSNYILIGAAAVGAWLLTKAKSVSGIGMTKQQKEDHLKRRGYKVQHVYSGANPHGTILLISPSGYYVGGEYESINQAHKRVFGY